MSRQEINQQFYLDVRASKRHGSEKQVAAAFGVSTTTVRNVWRADTWEDFKKQRQARNDQDQARRQLEKTVKGKQARPGLVTKSTPVQAVVKRPGHKTIDYKTTAADDVLTAHQLNAAWQAVLKKFDTFNTEMARLMESNNSLVGTVQKLLDALEAERFAKDQAQERAASLKRREAWGGIRKFFARREV